jgi:hypothetical protein
MSKSLLEKLSMSTEQTLLAALSMMAPDSTTKRSIEFRVYYDIKTGKILDYTTDDLPGDYIIVEREVFHQHRFDWSVKEGKMTPPKNIIGKLRPGDNGVPCDPKDVTLIVKGTDPNIKWKMHTYED